MVVGRVVELLIYFTLVNGDMVTNGYCHLVVELRLPAYYGGGTLGSEDWYICHVKQ